MLKWMRNRLTIAATILSTLLLAPVLSGCAAIGAAGTAISVANALSQPIEVPLKVRKGYYLLLAGATGMEHLAEGAVDTGLLTPGSERAVWVADRLNDLKAIVDAARIAYHAKDTKTLQEKIEAGNAIIEVMTPVVSKI